MTGLVRKAMLLAACAMILGAAAAMAGTPYPANCSIPCNILLAGKNPGSNAPEDFNALLALTSVYPNGINRVVVRDQYNNIVVGQDVTLDFTACATGKVSVCNAQTQPGLVVAGNQFTLITDGTGTVNFRLIGGSNNLGSPYTASDNTACVQIYAGINAPLGTRKVAMFDEYTASALQTGVKGADVYSWYKDFALDPSAARADYNCDGAVGGVDVFLWYKVFGPGNSAGGCSSMVFVP